MGPRKPFYRRRQRAALLKATQKAWEGSQATPMIFLGLDRQNVALSAIGAILLVGILALGTILKYFGTP